MLRAVFLLLLTLPCWAQFREIEFRFVPTPCESCTASLAPRMSKVRGVESAELAGDGILRLKLAEQNRARLELLRDMIEQDGTKVKSVRFTASGAIEKSGEASTFKAADNGAAYKLDGANLSPGRVLLKGEIADLPKSGTATIKVIEAVPEK
jgi:hypothetical protein